MRLARRKQGENNTPRPWRPLSPYGRHGAPPPAPPHTTISQHAVRQVYDIKTKEYICYYYLFKGTPSSPIDIALMNYRNFLHHDIFSKS
jgi:hypothetical protein